MCYLKVRRLRDSIALPFAVLPKRPGIDLKFSSPRFVGGEPSTQKYATRIMGLVKRRHWVLVTLLLANSAAMEALPLFLDRLVHPAIAVVISVTVVLMFGEVWYTKCDII